MNKQRKIVITVTYNDLGVIVDTKAEELDSSAQPERLTDDDFETIRIHLNAQKERLCNQKRWEEAEEYQRIIDRFMAFASAQPERKTGEWIAGRDERFVKCSECGMESTKNALMGIALFGEKEPHFCPNCGADMRERTEKEEKE